MIDKLKEWSKRHNITLDAYIELEQLLNDECLPEQQTEKQHKSEASVLQKVRMFAPIHNARMWRNNVGAYRARDGRLVRYGLANDSTALNKKQKSSDAIGITTIRITPEHIDKEIGVFTAAETKHADWVYKGTEEEQAQRNYLNLVRMMGGIAQFVTNPNEFWRGINEHF